MDLKEPTEIIINTTLVFHEEKPSSTEWGNGSIGYEIYYSTKSGIMQVLKIGAFGDRTLVKRFWDKRERKITLEEMLENIQELSKMPYDSFLKMIEE